MTKKLRCEKCGEVPESPEATIEMQIPITGEHWDLCDDCIDDIVATIEGEQ